MRIEDVAKRWDEHAAKHPIVPEMTFADGFLVLGAGTRLAEVGAPLDELSLVARLVAAHRRPIEASPLRHIRRALVVHDRRPVAGGRRSPDDPQGARIRSGSLQPVVGKIQS
jgi:hypothetical protein